MPGDVLILLLAHFSDSIREQIGAIVLQFLYLLSDESVRGVPHAVLGPQVVDQQFQQHRHHLFVLDDKVDLALISDVKRDAVPSVERDGVGAVDYLAPEHVDVLPHYPEAARKRPIDEAFDVVYFARRVRLFYCVIL